LTLQKNGKNTSEKCKKQREVPLINPLRIPLGWWVAMDKAGGWFALDSKPLMRGFAWYANTYFCIHTKGEVDWQDDWEHSLFTRAEILERWKQEYGDRWLEVAEEEQNVHTDR